MQLSLELIEKYDTFMKRNKSEILRKYMMKFLTSKNTAVSTFAGTRSLTHDEYAFCKEQITIYSEFEKEATLFV
jgi:hypothetical protein